MFKKLRLGVIGGALSSAVGRAHLIASCMDHEAEICAGFFSRNSERNIETANFLKLNTTHVHDNLDEFILKEKGNLDLVLVLTPTDSHFADLSKLIEEGFNVVCEKALALNSNESSALKNQLNKSNSFLAVIYNYSGYPFVREAREMIKSGELGDITHLEVSMPQESFTRLSDEGVVPLPQSWRLKEAKKIPKVFLDLGTHVHQMMNFLVNKEVQEVYCTSQNNGHFKNIVDNVDAVIKLKDSINCRISFGKSSLGNQNGLCFKVYGKSKSIEWTQVEPDKLIVSNQYGEKLILNRSSRYLKVANSSRYERFKAGHPSGFLEAFANYYQDIFEAFRSFKNKSKDSNQFCFGIEEAHEELLFLETLAHSSEIGETLKVKEYIKEVQNVA